MELRLACGSLLLALAACGAAGEPERGQPRVEAGAPVARSRLPRLTHAQWENTVRDLFQGRAPSGLSAVFPSDGEEGADALAVNDALRRAYQRAAEAVAEAVSKDDAAIGLFLPPDGGLDELARGRAFVARFGERAFRGPLSEGEAERLAQVVAGGADEGMRRPGQDSFHAGVELAVEAALQAPRFLYRVEASSQADARGWVRLSGHELASRLSYALWDTMPDDALFEDAQAGRLDHDEGLRRAAVRMLGDERAAERLVRAHDRMMGGERFAGITKEKSVFAGWDAALSADAREELRRFVRHELVEQGGGLGALLTSRTAFVNARLGALLGVEGAPAEGFGRVELPAERAGLLTRPGWLALNAGPAERDTIRRGVFVLRALLCREPGRPDPSAVEAARAAAVYPPDATNRQRVEVLTSGPGCQGCHQGINPAGFALERFDAAGRLVADEPTQAGPRPVDASGALALGEGEVRFDGAAALSEALARSPEAHRCYARRWIGELAGRPAQDDDQALVDEVGRLSLGGASARDLLLAVVSSATFRYRLSEAP